MIYHRHIQQVLFQLMKINQKSGLKLKEVVLIDVHFALIEI